MYQTFSNTKSERNIGNVYQKNELKPSFSMYCRYKTYIRIFYFFLPSNTLMSDVIAPMARLFGPNVRFANGHIFINNVIRVTTDAEDETLKTYSAEYAKKMHEEKRHEEEVIKNAPPQPRDEDGTVMPRNKNGGPGFLLTTKRYEKVNSRSSTSHPPGWTRMSTRRRCPPVHGIPSSDDPIIPISASHSQSSSQYPI